MSNLALSLPGEEPQLIQVAVVRPVAALSQPVKSVSVTEVALIGLVMCLLQVLDGTLTALGVLHQGITAEGNILIRSLMEAWGPVFALVVVKLFAIAVVGALCILAFRLPWITKALKVIAVIYVGAAIIPWTAILISRVM